MDNVAVVVERDDTGRVSQIPVRPNWQTQGQTHGTLKAFRSDASSPRNHINAKYTGLESLYHVLSDLFLPAGYPTSVSPDYLQYVFDPNPAGVNSAQKSHGSRFRYQIYNALQAFCNSLSGLLASRGALEGVGVGDASVSATYALFLTVLKDAFSRLTTIMAAYYFGTSLYPETKTFRYLADVFNDASTVLDTIVPFIGSINLSEHSAVLPSGPTLQIIVLCLSGGMKSLCALVAGGSKAALTNHFASPLSGKGDVGEVSAKDASRETVVGLSGMLLGTLLISYVNTRTLTYVVLFVLVGAHLLFNYLAVRAVVLRTLNRQRACILWTNFKAPVGTLATKALSPATVASKEILFGFPSNIRDTSTGRSIGRCVLGTSFRYIPSRCTAEHVTSALQVFEEERYVLFIAGGYGRNLRRATPSVCFKDGYRSIDQLQAWIHAIEVARRLYDGGDTADPADILRSTLLVVRETLPGFVRSLVAAGWETGDDSMMFGSPSHVMLGASDGEDRKKR